MRKATAIDPFRALPKLVGRLLRCARADYEQTAGNTALPRIRSAAEYLSGS